MQNGVHNDDDEEMAVQGLTGIGNRSNACSIDNVATNNNSIKFNELSNYTVIIEHNQNDVAATTTGTATTIATTTNSFESEASSYNTTTVSLKSASASASTSSATATATATYAGFGYYGGVSYKKFDF